jgi:hypothetical protein
MIRRLVDAVTILLVLFFALGHSGDTGMIGKAFGADPPTVTLSATPLSIAPGRSSTLTWSSTNATSCSIDQGIGAVAKSGSKKVSVAVTTTYTITATGSGGTATASVRHPWK